MSSARLISLEEMFLYLNVKNQYEKVEHIEALVSMMQMNSHSSSELSEILFNWAMKASANKLIPGSDIYDGMTIYFYLQFVKKAESLNIDIIINELVLKKKIEIQEISQAASDAKYLKVPGHNELIVNNKSYGFSPPLQEKKSDQPNYLQQIQTYLFNKISDDRYPLQENKTFKLTQTEDGLLVIEKSSSFPITEAALFKLTNTINDLDFLKEYIIKYNVEKYQVGVMDHFFALTFTKEVSEAIKHAYENGKLTSVNTHSFEDSLARLKLR